MELEFDAAKERERDIERGREGERGSLRERESHHVTMNTVVDYSYRGSDKPERKINARG